MRFRSEDEISVSHYRSGFREREKMRFRLSWVSAKGLQPQGFGHGSSAMDLEKMICHGFSIMR